MDPFLEGFDDDELRTFYLGNEKEPEYICSKCKNNHNQPIERGHTHA